MIDTVAANTLHRRSRVLRTHQGSTREAAGMDVLGRLAGAVVSDATAGIGIAGCSRLHHLEARWLWVQDEIAAHRLKVVTEANPADLATKHLLLHECALSASWWRQTTKLTHDSGTVNKFEDGSLCKDWLHWSPFDGVLKKSTDAVQNRSGGSGIEV